MNGFQKRINRLEQKLLLLAPHKLAHRRIYYKKHGSRLNLSHPGTYDELIHYYIVNRYDQSCARYADKYLVREYVKECGLEKLLVPLVAGPFYSFDEIDFDSLPNEFVIKTNHASGTKHYFICTDKNSVSKEKLRAQFTKALQENYAKRHCEYHYAGIRPCLLIEEMLHDRTRRMTDYKVVCAYGTPIAVLVCNDRNEGRDYYDLEWNHLDYTLKEFQSREENPKPGHLQEMLSAAAALSVPFPLSRIDFYDTDSGLYFGEITLTPSGGYHKNLTEKGQKELAEKLLKVIREKEQI